MSAPNFRIATFNVNSLRSRLHIVIPWLQNHQADVLCLQETKVRDEDFPVEAFEAIGYRVVFRGQKAYNGVAVASPHAIEGAAFGFDDDENGPEDEVRLIRCKVGGVNVVNTYVPQGRALEDPYFQYKLRWFQRLRGLFARHYAPDDLLVWTGDLNVAPEPRDVYAPDLLANHVCFHEDVRKALQKVEEWGLEDLFRRFHQEDGQYTFYDYRVRGAIKRGMGWRLDHFMVTWPVAERASGCYIDMEPRLAEKPSDHTLLVADVKMP